MGTARYGPGLLHSTFNPKWSLIGPTPGRSRGVPVPWSRFARERHQSAWRIGSGCMPGPVVLPFQRRAICEQNSKLMMRMLLQNEFAARLCPGRARRRIGGAAFPVTEFPTTRVGSWQGYRDLGLPPPSAINGTPKQILRLVQGCRHSLGPRYQRWRVWPPPDRPRPSPTVPPRASPTVSQSAVPGAP